MIKETAPGDGGNIQNASIEFIRIDNKGFDGSIKHHPNPSFQALSPHCTLLGRYCFCQWDDGVHKCELKDGVFVECKSGVHSTDKVLVSKKRRKYWLGKDLSYDVLKEFDAAYEERKKRRDNNELV